MRTILEISLIIIVCWLASCNMSHQQRSLIKLKRELNVDVWRSFKKYSPNKESDMKVQSISYYPSYEAFGYAIIYQVFETCDSSAIIYYSSSNHPIWSGANYNVIGNVKDGNLLILQNTDGLVLVPNLFEEVCQTDSVYCYSLSDFVPAVYYRDSTAAYNSSLDNYNSNNTNELTIGSFINQSKGLLIYWMIIK